MDEAEIKRLRREIHRTFGSSPHKKKLWLALLEIHAAKEKKVQQPGRSSVKSGAEPRN
jgi:hypothetical protein